jgi:hypothetical protein
MKIKSRKKRKAQPKKRKKKRWLVKEDKFLKIQGVLNLPFTRILMPKSKDVKS